MTTDASDVEKARADLAATLEAIEDKLNLPKQARLAVDRARRRVQGLRENPTALVAVAAVAAVLIGGAVWLIVRVARK
ncbi:DUF3618 domain-containing protein [Diaminobutyricibacter tongyongensis]|uniref:DUF3618 domain-containing protein n=1 Tax=Leifsonia tongyongensis TaxID=1268043 RepID=A0A6L9XVY6_9MICO|nr:DUF3618 domain-containing protein [Diaminobutyricibacter tongyongensis]NEN05543.1 DUF3618 domain-containing protein [Diaminobutyricibacter tongyongensis]